MYGMWCTVIQYCTLYWSSNRAIHQPDTTIYQHNNTRNNTVTSTIFNHALFVLHSLANVSLHCCSTRPMCADTSYTLLHAYCRMMRQLH